MNGRNFPGQVTNPCRLAEGRACRRGGKPLGRAIERWAALAYLEAERRFNKIQGHRDLWILAQALGRTEQPVDRRIKAA